jgi:cytochrome d ubiquinol oxidase subunit II
VLPDFWFITIGVLWAGFFLLEGFDFGVGMLLPVIGHDDTDRRTILDSIGPVWDGNEVWLLTAGGATFAAFPLWYSSLFSGYYLAFALLLIALILRGLFLEYRNKLETSEGRAWADRLITLGSGLAALLVGVAFADLVRGSHLDSHHRIVTGFWSLLSPYALLGGLFSVALFAFHGATFLALKTDGPVRERAGALAPRLGVAATIMGAGLLLWTQSLSADLPSAVVSAVSVLALGQAARWSRRRQEGRAFAGTALAVLLVPVAAFTHMWPNVLVDRGDASRSLSISFAASSHYTLTVMTVLALVVTPIVLCYQAWSYWVFRQRLGRPS